MPPQRADHGSGADLSSGEHRPAYEGPDAAAGGDEVVLRFGSKGAPDRYAQNDQEVDRQDGYE